MSNFEQVAVEEVFTVDQRLDLARKAMNQALVVLEGKVDTISERARKCVQLMQALDTTFSAVGLPPMIRRGIEIHCETVIERCHAMRRALEAIGGGE